MDRPIIGFALDAEGAWVALLNCGHRQHVRHEPPFWNRPWVTSPEGRDGRIGVTLPCAACDAFEMPEQFVPYSRTPVFSPETVPVALQSENTTRAGVWAKIVVTAGRLRYHVRLLERVVELTAGESAVVVPEVPHRVELLADTRFYVEFFRAPDAPAGTPSRAE